MNRQAKSNSHLGLWLLCIALYQVQLAKKYWRDHQTFFEAFPKKHHGHQRNKYIEGQTKFFGQSKSQFFSPPFSAKILPQGGEGGKDRKLDKKGVMSMEKTRYTTEQTTEAGRLLSVIESVPEEKRSIVTMMAEAFINGMRAQEQLMATTPWK